MLKTSKFIEKIEVFRKVETQDANGDTVRNLVSIAILWADIRFLNGKEFIKSGIASSNSVSIRLRWDSKADKITANDVVIWKGKTINITAVLPDMDTRAYIDLVGEIGITNSNNRLG